MVYALKAFNFLLTLLQVLLIFNLLIIVHEIGHFLAARWRGLYVDGFGIWFGKPLWKKKINGVTYSLGSIPAGGFVKLPQMAPMEAMEGQTEVKVEDLPPISPLDKIIVAFAGPLFSFGLALVFAVLVWNAGKPVSETESTTVIGSMAPDYPAKAAGLQVGDKILEVDGHPVSLWGGMREDSIKWRIVRSEGDKVPIKVLRDGKEMTFYPEPIIPEKPHWWNRSGLREIGIAPKCTPVIFQIDEEKDTLAKQMGLKKGDRILAINHETLLFPDGIYDYLRDHPGIPYEFTVETDGVQRQVPYKPADVVINEVPDYPNSPAKRAGLKVGDIVKNIDNQDIKGREAYMDYVRKHAGTKITLNIVRDGKDMAVDIVPEIPEHAPNGIKNPMIGVGFENDDGFKFDGMGVPVPKYVYPTPVEQIKTSMMMIVNTVNAVFSPKSKIGIQQMGGPVMMMNAYFTMLSNEDGWRLALWFSVILNVNLALLNLLPIPVLDGGHITLAIVEGIRKRPVNFKVLEIIQSACAVVIIGFMLFIVTLDVQDLPFLSDKTPPISFKAPSAEK